MQFIARLVFGARSVFFSMVALLAVMPGLATAEPLDRLIELSGIEAQLAATPEAFKRDFLVQVDGAFDDQTLREFESMIDRALASEVMVARLRSYLAARLSAEEVREVTRWYESDFGRRVTEFEVAASAPAALEAMLASMDTLLNDAQRVVSVQEIESHLQLVDYNLALVMVTQGALLDAIVAAAGREARIDRVSMQAMLDVKLAAIRPDVEYSTVAHLVYTYRELSAREMESYLGVLQQPAMENFNRSMMLGIARMFEEAFDEFAVRLGENIVQSQQIASVR